MPLRVIGYDGASYRDQIKESRDEDGKRRRSDAPRYPVITIILHFGYKRRWNKPKTLFENLGGNLDPRLAPYVSDYRVNVFDVAFLEDETVAKFQSDFRIVADYFVQMRKNHDYEPSPIEFKHVQEVLQMMSVFTKDRRFEDAVNESRKGGGPRNMCEFIDRAESRGIQKGMLRGELQGALKNAEQVYRNCIARGMSEEDALAISGVEEARRNVQSD